MRFPKFIYVVVLLAAQLNGCAPRMETFVPLATDRSFLPLKVGKQYIYRVDSVLFTFTGDTFSGYHFIRETIADTFTDLTGQTLYRLVREKSTTPDGPWADDSVWVASWQGNKAIRQENNRKIIKIHFPLQNGTTWNGNLYNELANTSSQLFRMERVGMPFSGRFNTYNNTITITQYADTNCVNSIVRREVYAQDIGMVFQERKAFDLEAGCTGRIVYGKRFIIHLVSHE